MNTNFNTTAAGTAAQQPFDRADFRLNYGDMNKITTAPSRSESLYATEEFPFLTDTVLWALISSLVRTRMPRMGVNPDKSNVTFQGWAERVMRNAGLAGLHMPEGSFFDKWAFRLRVRKMCAEYLHNEIKKDNGF